MSLRSSISSGSGRMRLRFDVVRRIGLAALVLGCGSSPKEFQARTPRAGAATHRTFTSVRWDTVWYRPGSEQDTSLLLPTMIVADERAVYALDIGGPRVVAFRAMDGVVSWMVGHAGGGPGEFRAPTNLVLGPDGSIVVTDAKGNRLTVLRADGTMRQTVPLNAAFNAQRACPLGPDDFLVKQIVDGAPQIVRIDTTGSVKQRYALPWKVLRQLPSLARQIAFTPLPDRHSCVVATFYGPGFAIDSMGHFGGTHPYIERFLPPKVIVSPHPSGGYSTHFAERRIAALSVAVEHDTMSVLFDGLTNDRARLLDFYRVKDGAYLGSVRLPHREMSMARAGGTYFFLEYRGGLYNLLAVRMLPGAPNGLEDTSR